MHRTLERCRAALRASLDGVTVETAGDAPPGKWSIAGIIDHLDLAYAGTTAAITRTIEKGAPLERHPLTFRQRVARLLILRLGSVPAGRESPKHLVPQGRRFAEVTAVIEPHLLVLDQRLKQAALAFGSRAPIANHPFLGPCSVADWRRFHLSHTRHHLKQVESRKSEVKSRASAASR